jgi:hypothetical protein
MFSLFSPLMALTRVTATLICSAPVAIGWVIENRAGLYSGLTGFSNGGRYGHSGTGSEKR